VIECFDWKIWVFFFIFFAFTKPDNNIPSANVNKHISLTPPHINVWPKPGTGFSAPHMGIFVLNGFRWKVVVRFVDLDVIVDHHCLSFHLKILEDKFSSMVVIVYCVFTIFHKKNYDGSISICHYILIIWYQVLKPRRDIIYTSCCFVCVVR